MPELLKPDICVIGAGAGGLSVAAAAVAFGVQVVLVEKGWMGGHLRVGAVPSKSLFASSRHAHAITQAAAFGLSAQPEVLDFARVRDHLRDVVAGITPNDSLERYTGLGVRIIEGEARFADPQTLMVGETVRIRARRFVIATGSSPAPPPIPGLEATPHETNETIFELEVFPDHLVILGAGPVELEHAQAFRRLGADVTVLAAEVPLAHEDPECVDILLDALAREGIDIRTGVKIANISAASADDTGHGETSAGAAQLVEAPERMLEVETKSVEKQPVSPQNVPEQAQEQVRKHTHEPADSVVPPPAIETPPLAPQSDEATAIETHAISMPSPDAERIDGQPVETQAAVPSATLPSETLPSAPVQSETAPNASETGRSEPNSGVTAPFDMLPSALSLADEESGPEPIDETPREAAILQENEPDEAAESPPISAPRIHVVLTSADGEERIEASHLLVATERRPNLDGLGLENARIETTPRAIVVDRRLRTTNKRVYAIGDVAGGPPFTHAATYHASLVIRDALFNQPSVVKEDLIPRVALTDPELAQVGLTEAQARERGYGICVLRWPYTENDRAQAERTTIGHIKVITDKKGRILGASIVGASAGDLISMWALAISQNLNIKALAGIVVPYPTLSEIGKRVALSYFTPSLSSPWVRRIIGFLRSFG